jgi:alpha-2-macroglobulin
MYRVSYLARASSVGTFVVPTRIEAMYSPEVFGRTGASTLAVKAT